MVTFGSFVLQSGFIYVFTILWSLNTIVYPPSPHPIPPSLCTLLRTEKTQEGLLRTRTKNELRNVEKFKKYLVRRVDRLTYQLLSRPPLSPPPPPFPFPSPFYSQSPPIPSPPLSPIPIPPPLLLPTSHSPTLFLPFLPFFPVSPRHSPPSLF